MNGSSGIRRSDGSSLLFLVHSLLRKKRKYYAGKKVLELFISHDREGIYFNFPFTMPSNIEELTLSYHYERHREQENQISNGVFVSKQEINIIDIGLIAPDGIQVGASGSEKNEITLSATSATPGYKPYPLISGEWQIIVGAYKIAPEGVTVSYELSFTNKHLQLFKGDLHTHTMASDGVLTAQELGWRALRHGLDFLAVTDHNQLINADSLPRIPGITLIPGVEWTHYLGHANFFGVDYPYDTPFASNTIEEVTARFKLAQKRGALIIINHPLDEGSGFKFDMNTLPFDCLEVWHGPMRESNLRAVGLWQNMLAAEKKVPITGGSDYHKDNPFQILGGPTTCVYSMSASQSDILDALKSGHTFITFYPNGPTLALSSGSAIMGDSLPWSLGVELKIEAGGLLKGDIIRVITGKSSETILEAPSNGRTQAVYSMKTPGFARVEILRSFFPGLPMLPALISNPIYFDE